MSRIFLDPCLEESEEDMAALGLRNTNNENLNGVSIENGDLKFQVSSDNIPRVGSLRTKTDENNLNNFDKIKQSENITIDAIQIEETKHKTHQKCVFCIICCNLSLCKTGNLLFFCLTGIVTCCLCYIAIFGLFLALGSLSPIPIVTREDTFSTPKNVALQIFAPTAPHKKRYQITKIEKISEQPRNGISQVMQKKVLNEKDPTQNEKTMDYVTYTPDKHWTGKDTFTYTYKNEFDENFQGKISVLVTNTPPIPVALEFNCLRNSKSNNFNLFTKNFNGKQISDADKDEILRIVGVKVAKSVSSSGEIVESGSKIDTFKPDGTFFFTPGPNFLGTETLEYTVSDFSDATAKGIATISITNIAPVPSKDNFVRLAKYEENFLRVLSNDADLDPLRIVSITNPRYGSVLVAENGTSVKYMPSLNYWRQPTNSSCKSPNENACSEQASFPKSVVDSFEYTATDGLASATTTVVVTVENSPPTCKNETIVLPRIRSQRKDVANLWRTVPLDIKDADVIDPLFFEIKERPQNGKMDIITQQNKKTTPLYLNSPTNAVKQFVDFVETKYVLKYLPKQTDVNYVDTFKFKVSDAFDSNYCEIYFKVENLPPIVDEFVGPIEVSMHSQKKINLSPNIYDLNGDTIEIMDLNSQPTQATPANNGKISWFSNLGGAIQIDPMDPQRSTLIYTTPSSLSNTKTNPSQFPLMDEFQFWAVEKDTIEKFNSSKPGKVFIKILTTPAELTSSIVTFTVPRVEFKSSLLLNISSFFTQSDPNGDFIDGKRIYLHSLVSPVSMAEVPLIISNSNTTNTFDISNSRCCIEYKPHSFAYLDEFRVWLSNDPEGVNKISNPLVVRVEVVNRKPSLDLSSILKNQDSRITLTQNGTIPVITGNWKDLFYFNISDFVSQEDKALNNSPKIDQASLRIEGIESKQQVPVQEYFKFFVENNEKIYFYSVDRFSGKVKLSFRLLNNEGTPSDEMGLVFNFIPITQPILCKNQLNYILKRGNSTVENNKTLVVPDFVQKNCNNQLGTASKTEIESFSILENKIETSGNNTFGKISLINNRRGFMFSIPDNLMAPGKQECFNLHVFSLEDAESPFKTQVCILFQEENPLDSGVTKLFKFDPATGATVEVKDETPDITTTKVVHWNSDNNIYDIFDNDQGYIVNSTRSSLPLSFSKIDPAGNIYNLTLIDTLGSAKIVLGRFIQFSPNKNGILKCLAERGENSDIAKQDCLLVPLRYRVMKNKSETELPFLTSNLNFKIVDKDTPKNSLSGLIESNFFFDLYPNIISSDCNINDDKALQFDAKILKKRADDDGDNIQIFASNKNPLQLSYPQYTTIKIDNAGILHYSISKTLQLDKNSNCEKTFKTPFVDKIPIIVSDGLTSENIEIMISIQPKNEIIAQDGSQFSVFKNSGKAQIDLSKKMQSQFQTSADNALQIMYVRPISNFGASVLEIEPETKQTVNFKPVQGFAGNYKFEFRAITSDFKKISNSAILTVNVENKPLICSHAGVRRKIKNPNFSNSGSTNLQQVMFNITSLIKIVQNVASTVPSSTDEMIECAVFLGNDLSNTKIQSISEVKKGNITTATKQTDFGTNSKSIEAIAFVPFVDAVGEEVLLLTLHDGTDSIIIEFVIDIQNNDPRFVKEFATKFKYSSENEPKTKYFVEETSKNHTKQQNSRDFELLVLKNDFVVDTDMGQVLKLQEGSLKDLSNCFSSDSGTIGTFRISDNLDSIIVSFAESLRNYGQNFAKECKFSYTIHDGNGGLLKDLQSKLEISPLENANPNNGSLNIVNLGSKSFSFSQNLTNGQSFSIIFENLKKEIPNVDSNTFANARISNISCISQNSSSKSCVYGTPTLKNDNEIVEISIPQGACSTENFKLRFIDPIQFKSTEFELDIKLIPSNCYCTAENMIDMTFSIDSAVGSITSTQFSVITQFISSITPSFAEQGTQTSCFQFSCDAQPQSPFGFNYTFANSSKDANSMISQLEPWSSSLSTISATIDCEGRSTTQAILCAAEHLNGYGRQLPSSSSFLPQRPDYAIPQKVMVLFLTGTGTTIGNSKSFPNCRAVYDRYSKSGILIPPENPNLANSNTECVNPRNAALQLQKTFQSSKDWGWKIVVIGIGCDSSTCTSEFKEIATSQERSYFWVSDFKDLTNLKQKVVDSICDPNI